MQHPSPLLAASLRTLVLSAVLLWYGVPLHAQVPERIIVSLGTGSAFLGSGDQSAVMHSVAVVKTVNDWLGVRVGMDYMNSTNRSFDGVPFHGGDFRERVFWVGDMGLEFMPFRIDTGEFEHRFGAFAGLTAWERDEEIGGSVCYPLCTSHPDAVSDIAKHLAPNERLYTFEYNDGPGGEQDGLYALISRSYHAREVGWLAEIHYSLAFRRIVPGVRVGFRNYSGATALTKSLALGVRL